MWTVRENRLDNATIHFQLEKEGDLLSVSDVIKAWQNDASFRAFYHQLLAAVPFPAYFWELPAMTSAQTAQDFEFVIVNSPTLARVTADPAAFQSYFVQDEVVVFPSLGGDATLVVPSPPVSYQAYAHLAQFVRTAPVKQIDSFWQAVGRAYTNKLSGRPLWLSTSGLGVYWLHVRLDDRPKYYTHSPYRRRPAQS